MVVPAGHGTGKSYVAAGAALHYLYTRPDSRVILLGPTHKQVSEVLWPEVLKAWKGSQVPLPGRILQGSSLKIVVDDKWELVCSSADTSHEALAGRHSGFMLIICDEASWTGYDGVIEDLEGLNASHYLFLGNPLRHGRFKALCDQADGTRIARIQISSLDSPHAHLDRSPVGLADRGYIEDMRASYGEDSPIWLVRVLGEFTEEDTHTLIPSDWLDRCLAPHLPAPISTRWLGADLSAGTGAGDLCVIVVRDRNGILFMDSSASWDFPEEVATRMASLVKQYQVPDGHVVYDRGGLGIGFDYALKRQGIASAKGYVGSEDGGSVATRFRGACAWSLRERLNPHRHRQPFHIPQHYLDLMRKEIGELRYELAGKGMIDLEAKAIMKKRLGRSPDRLDAVIISMGFDVIEPDPMPTEQRPLHQLTGPEWIAANSRISS